MAWADRLWDAAFKDVEFQCRLTTDDQERAVNVAEYPYRDGALTEDLGRRARRIQISISIFGDDYEDQLATLLAVLDEDDSGELVHPVFGPVNAQVQSWRVNHSADLRDSADVDVTFIENAIDTPGIAIRESAASLGDAAESSAFRLASLLDADQRAEYLGRVSNTLSILRSPDRAIPALRDAQRALQDVQNITRELQETYRAVTDPQSFTIIRQLTATYALFGRLFQRSTEDAPPYRTFITNSAISLRVLAHQLYGDQSRAEEIANLNNLVDSFVPAGVSLKVKAR